jgi:hypothetical protein
MCRPSLNLGASTSWNSQSLSRPVRGFLYLFYLLPFIFHNYLRTLRLNFKDKQVAVLTQTFVLLWKSEGLRCNGSPLFPRESEHQTRTGLLVSVEADIGVCSASAITFVRLLIISDLITGFQQHRENKSETKVQYVPKNLWGCFDRTYHILPANITGLPSHRLTLQRCNCCLILGWG